MTQINQKDADQDQMIGSPDSQDRGRGEGSEGTEG